MRVFDLTVRPSEMFLYELGLIYRIVNDNMRSDYINDSSSHEADIYEYYDIDYLDDDVCKIITIKAVSAAAVNYFEYLTEEEKEKYYRLEREE